MAARIGRSSQLAGLAVPMALALALVGAAGVPRLDRSRARRAVVFPDGSTLELSYPRGSAAGGLPFAPAAAFHYSPYGDGPNRPDAASAQPCCGRGLVIRRATVADLFRGRLPTTVYAGARGQRVPFYDSSAVDGGVADLPQLAFQFGPWAVLAYDYPAGDRRGSRMTDEQRAVVAASLDGYQTSAGFLVLEPWPPLCLERFIDGPDGVLGHPQADAFVAFYLYQVTHGPGLVRGTRSLTDDIEIAAVRRQARWHC